MPSVKTVPVEASAGASQLYRTLFNPEPPVSLTDRAMVMFEVFHEDEALLAETFGAVVSTVSEPDASLLWFPAKSSALTKKL